MGQPARIENTGKEMNTQGIIQRRTYVGDTCRDTWRDTYKKRQTEGHTDKSPFYPTLEDSNDEKGIRIRDDIKPTQMLQNIS